MVPNRRRFVRGLALAATALAVALSSPAASGGAAATEPAVVEVGWWTRVPTQSAPDGGFAVGVAPDGPTSVAAIRLQLGETGVTSATVDVAETGGTLQVLAALRVCAATTPWTAAAGGPLTDAPAADCSNQPVRLARNSSGAWRADVSPFTAGRSGAISLVVLPEPDSKVASGLPSTYDVQFGAPRLTAVAAPTPEPIVEPTAPLGAAPAADLRPSAGFFAPLMPPADTPLPTTMGAPAVDIQAPLAPLASDDGPSPWRWQLWLQLVVLALLLGAAAGTLRWSILSGRLAELVPHRHPLP